jgi:ATP-dependent Clp protease adaptor protein ClpS
MLPTAKGEPAPSERLPIAEVWMPAPNEPAASAPTVAAGHGAPRNDGQASRKGDAPPLVATDRRAPGDDDGRSGTAIVTRTKPRTKRPNLYRVLLLNDDYTPMEFVVHVLQRFFNKDRDDATRIMLHVHQTGVGECGVFTYEVAETKVTQVMDFARKHQHPLQCVMEKN